MVVVMRGGDDDVKMKGEFLDMRQKSKSYTDGRGSVMNLMQKAEIEEGRKSLHPQSVRSW